MACYTGTTGALEMGSTAVAQVQNWTVTHTQETLDDTVLGDTYRSFCAGLKTWEGSAEVIWADNSVSGNVDSAFQIGLTGTLTAYWDNTAGVTELKLSGPVIITSIEYSSNVGELAMATVNFQGTGALTIDSSITA